LMLAVPFLEVHAAVFMQAGSATAKTAVLLIHGFNGSVFNW